MQIVSSAPPKKKMLFLCIGHFGLYKIFEEGFATHGHCDVTTILYKGYFYQYRSVWERLYNVFSKIFLGVNIKIEKTALHHFQGLSAEAHFDYLFVICPEMMHPSALDYITAKADQSIVYYWDGFDHFPAYLDTVKYFDEHYSFDPVDAKKYGLQFITNFHFYGHDDRPVEQDFYFVGTCDRRYPEIERIAKCLSEQGQQAVFKLLIDKPEWVPAERSPFIELIEEPVPMSEAKEHFKRSRYVLDVHKEIQHGLSFRIFEAMGMKKKLITTNADVRNYDFYRPQNIFVWESSTDRIPDEFFATPYLDLPDEIFRKYSREHWVRTVLKMDADTA